MPDIYAIYNHIHSTHFAWHYVPYSMQYQFEANILSWGFLHV